MLKPPLICLALIISSTLTATNGLSPVDSSSPAVLYGPAVLHVTVQYRAYFQVPYPDFHLDIGNGRFVFTPQTEIYSEEVENNWGGTGFIITPDGYLLTNAHIAGTEYYEKFGYLLDHAYEIADFFLDDQVISYEVYDLFLQSYHRYLIENGNFTQKWTDITVFFGGEQYSVSHVASGDPIGLRTSKDVALLKANVSEGYLFPTVRLGDTEEVEVGEKVIILGYPEEHPEYTSALNKPQTAIGSVVDMKPMEGWDALQTDAEITYGFSGGPAFNKQGDVIGISTFGTISPLTKTTANFLVPINIAQSLLETTEIENTRSIIDERYEIGLGYLTDGEYNNSINEFNTVLNLNPMHAYARYYLQIAQQGMDEYKERISTEATTTHDTTSKNPKTQYFTTTVTRVNYKTETKTFILTVTLPPKASNDNTILLLVTLIAIIAVSSTIILGLLRPKHRAILSKKIPESLKNIN